MRSAVLAPVAGFLAVAAILAACGSSGDLPVGERSGDAGGSEERSITVVSWGGSYARACVLGYHEAFTAETGIEVKMEDYNGGPAPATIEDFFDLALSWTAPSGGR